MKKLVHIFNSIEYSGAERMIFSLHEFYKAEFAPYIVSTGSTKGEFYHEFQEYFECRHIPISPKRNLKYFKDFFGLLKFYRTEKIDIVHIHPSSRFFYHVMAAKLGGVKCVVRQIHNNFEFTGIIKFKEILGRSVAKYLGTKMISISQSVQRNELIRFRNKTQKVDNFYNEDVIRPGTAYEKRMLRDKLGIPADAFALISIGSCTKRKQHDHIINVVAELKKVIPEVFYVHLGDGTLEKKEKTICKELGISQDVMFSGNVENVCEFLVASDLYLMTSKIEGLGNATLEAMGAKLPVILYDTPGSRDLGTEGAPGILVKPHKEDLKSKVIEIYNSPHILSSAAHDSHEYAFKVHSKAQAIKNWKKVYLD